MFDEFSTLRLCEKDWFVYLLFASFASLVSGIYIVSSNSIWFILLSSIEYQAAHTRTLTLHFVGKAFDKFLFNTMLVDKLIEIHFEFAICQS